MNVSNIDCGACPNITDGCHDICQKSAQKKPKPVRRWGANWHMEMMYEMHNGPYVRSADFNIERRERKAAQSELAALREELASMKSQPEWVQIQILQNGIAERDADLTAAEQRNAAMTDLLDSISKCYAATLSLYTLDKIVAVLTKPTESGASE